MTKNWTSLLGEFNITENDLIFKGNLLKYEEGQEGAAIGNLISDEYFSEGKITAEIEFSKVAFPTACEIIIYYDPSTQYFVSVGLGGAGNMYSVRSFARSWTNLALTGDYINLKEGKLYKVEVELQGSNLTLTVDNINVLKTIIPFNLPTSQVGLWCHSRYDIILRSFQVDTQKPKVFVVMQFSSPY